MICKDNQNMIDTLLSLKDTSSGSTTINRIGSYEDSTTQCMKIINEIMDQYKTKNKIASSQSTTTPTTIKMGEVAEFQRLLHTHLQRFSPQEL